MRRTSVLAVVLTLAASSLASAQTCYQEPFSTGTITDPWGCTAACGRSTPHRGTDFGVACGSAIPSIADGVVVANQQSPCLGWVIAVQHPDGLVSGYCHMHVPSPLAVGTPVSRGQIIGTSARDGSCAEGCHLHLTLGASLDSWWTGTTIDPVAYIESHAAGSTCVDGGGPLTEDVVSYAPPETTDLNGDGRADMCARASDGVHCSIARGTGAAAGWDNTWPVVGLTDAASWNRPQYYATMRMGDVNGDGRADLCARSGSAFHCLVSTGNAFAPLAVWYAGMADASGWDRPQYYTTIRLADVDGDGKDDLCARDSEGFHCWISDGSAFVRRVEGPTWRDASGYDQAQYFGTLRMADVNGDDRADACIRSSVGMSCAISDGNGFPTSIDGPAWTNASGYDHVEFWSTIRAGDIDGDGMDDLCIRTSIDLRCFFATGTGFAAATTVALLADASGWADPTNYRTLRVGDIDGDGAEDLCARSDSSMQCWSWNGTTFDSTLGPAWSDANGWNQSGAYYATIRLADYDGDGRDDLCSRSGDGWACTLARGDGTFAASPIDLGSLTDASGWATSPSFWATILSSGRCRAHAETCNGTDDDCDATVDEDTCVDATVSIDAAVSIGPDAGTTRDASVSRGDAGAIHHVTSGCGCTAGGARTTLSLPALLALALLVHHRRQRRAEPRASTGCASAR